MTISLLTDFCFRKAPFYPKKHSKILKISDGEVSARRLSQAYSSKVG